MTAGTARLLLNGRRPLSLRRGPVVARSWSEMCAAVDIPVGTLLIVVSIIR